MSVPDFVALMRQSEERPERDQKSSIPDFTALVPAPTAPPVPIVAIVSAIGAIMFVSV